MYHHKINKALLTFHNFTTTFKELTYTTEELEEIYKVMYRIRKFEETAYDHYKHMRGFLHLCIGQESIYAALPRNKNNNIITSYRCHGPALVCCSVREVARELLGRKSGLCKGKGGSMHLYKINKDKHEKSENNTINQESIKKDGEKLQAKSDILYNNLYGGHGIVGAQVPLGVGLAFGEKYLQSNNTTFVFMGDGGSNQGQVYESYLLSIIYDLNVIFIIENNKFGMWTPVENVNFDDDFYKRYNIKGIRIRCDSFFMIDAVLRELKGPIVVQIDCNRFCGHAMGDTEFYREKEKHEDALLEVEEKLAHLNCDVSEIKKNVDSEIKKEFEDAMKEGLTEESELFTDVYS